MWSASDTRWIRILRLGTGFGTAAAWILPAVYLIGSRAVVWSLADVERRPPPPSVCGTTTFFALGLPILLASLPALLSAVGLSAGSVLCGSYCFVVHHASRSVLQVTLIAAALITLAAWVTFFVVLGTVLF